MTRTDGLAALPEADVLAFATSAADAIRQGECDLLRAAYAWAMMHDPDRLDATQSVLPGRERARQCGGAGTPAVCEFAAAELGARIGRTTYAAAQLMADALDLHHRLPHLWRRVEAGEVRSSYARHVCARTRDLTSDEAAYVDTTVTESADGRIPWTRFETLVEAKIAAAAPETARLKEERATRATFAKKLRGEAHGMATFMVRADIATIETIDSTLTALAATLVDHLETDDERRVEALRMLVTPTRDDDTGLADLAPMVHLYLHAYPGSDGGSITRLEGHGAVTEAWITRVLGPTARFKITPVLDLTGQSPVDAYEIPDRHRQAVHLISPADTFPYASSLSRHMEIDHTVPHDHGGESGVGNYGPLTTTHHRIKTHGRWQVRQPFPGIYLWRDPHGQHYLVDHTGTRALPAPAHAADRRPMTVEIYRNLPDLVLAS